MASLGQGSAKVDLVLNQDQFAPGDEINGTLHVYGGTVEQSIDNIEVTLELEIHNDENYFHHTVYRIPIPVEFEIAPEERTTFPFTFHLPSNIPISGNTISYFFQTQLSIIGGIDHKDSDPITIVPPTGLQNVLTALQQLGFYEKQNSRMIDHDAQLFAFAPSDYRNEQFHEITFTVTVLPVGLEILLNVDTTTSGKKEHLIFLEHAILYDRYELASYWNEFLKKVVVSRETTTHYYSQFSGTNAAIGGYAAGGLKNR
jgi:sporulation-control protein